ncbi:hypothetical protein BRD00_15380 [Halobacteriales archaeon QS_8_69_26]|nr:MAG: hypothetical protein BRD00_15380 [Halobacteriales archaeon QS_8_69_26]
MGRGPVRGPETIAVLLVVGLCLAAGCSGPFDNTDRRTYGVPETPTVDGTTTAAGSSGAAGRDDGVVRGSEPRYLGLRPSCERPPSLVVAVQVGALRNDGADDRGLWTAYAFYAPGYRWALGPFPRYVQLMEADFRPLLESETVTYGPVERSNGTASVNVTVGTLQGERTNYRWHLERHPDGEHEGCWMTTAVRNGSRTSSTNGSAVRPDLPPSPVVDHDVPRPVRERR